MDPLLQDRIVDAALALAEESSWEQVRLHEVARRLGIGLSDVRSCFREKEDIVDAWFDRADHAMLVAAAAPEVADLPSRDRLQESLLAWLGALAAHRRATREMILGKLEFGHVHFQWAGLMRISRTVQWWREAAGRRAPFPWRAFEETALTSIYLATFICWMSDHSEQSRRTRELLFRLLSAAEPCARWVPGVGTDRLRSAAWGGRHESEVQKHTH
jgi:ubiquinone biosynthesis protein COQ9